MTGFYALKFVHIMSAAVWFGTSLPLPGDVRRTLQAGTPHTSLLSDRVNRLLKIVIGAGILTVLSGLGIIFHAGGFGNLPPRIHIGFTLTLVLLGIGGAFIAPTWKAIEARLGSEESTADNLKLSKRISMFTGIQHLLWSIILALMIFKGG